MKFFFPEFNPSHWLKEHADNFKNGKVIFDETLEVHKADV